MIKFLSSKNGGLLVLALIVLAIPLTVVTAMNQTQTQQNAYYISPTSVPNPLNIKVWGDVDCDGQITGKDILTIQRYLVSLPPISPVPSCPSLGSKIIIGGALIPPWSSTPIPTPTPVPTKCAYNYQCPSGSYCINSVCQIVIKSSITPTPTRPPALISPWSVSPVPSKTPTPALTNLLPGASCTSNSQCRSSSCLNHYCQ